MANDLLAGFNAGSAATAPYADAARFRSQQKLEREELAQRRQLAAAQIAAAREDRNAVLQFQKDRAAQDQENFLLGLSPEQIAFYNARVAQQTANLQRQAVPSNAQVTIDSSGVKYRGTVGDALNDSQHPVIGKFIGGALQKTVAPPADEKLPDWTQAAQPLPTAPPAKNLSMPFAQDISGRVDDYGYSPNLPGTLPVPKAVLDQRRAQQEAARQRAALEQAELQARTGQLTLQQRAAEVAARQQEFGERAKRTELFSGFLEKGYSPDQAAQLVSAYDPSALPGQLPKMAAAKPKLTAEQALAVGFGQRMQLAEQVLSTLPEDYGTNFLSNAANSLQSTVGLQSPKFAKFEQAKKNWISAVLRRESGAAIAQSEYENAEREYFAQPGDPPEVLEQKRQSRAAAFQGLIGALPSAVQESLGAQSRSGSLSFKSPAEAEAADLPPGTLITINGRRAVVEK